MSALGPKLMLLVAPSMSAFDPKRTCNALGDEVRYFKEDIPRSPTKIRRC
jgi:hypothetical protein